MIDWFGDMRHWPIIILVCAGVWGWMHFISCVTAPEEPIVLADDAFDKLEFEEKIEHLEPYEIEEVPGGALTVFETEEKPAAVERKIVRYEYRIEERFTKKLYATCYSQWDSPAEAKGIYANNKFDDFLHRQERRIQRHHYTVAINPEMKEYHEALIELPGGVWTHKYRVHVPGYNKPLRPTQDSTYENAQYLPRDQRLLSVFNHGYFSVPRDRMKQRGRIDVLFTTAGNYATIKQRQGVWARKNTHEWPCTFYEITKWAVYDSGPPVKVE